MLNKTFHDMFFVKRLMGKKRSKDGKCDINTSIDLVDYLGGDLGLIYVIMMYLSLSGIRAYSYSSKGNRELTLRLGLIKYKLKREYSRYFYKNGLGETNKIGEKISISSC